MKRIIIPFLLALILILSVSGVALADDPTTVTVTWGGGGGLSGNMNSGDAAGGFDTGGSAISGTWTATDSNNNPYSYGVDNFASLFTGSVTDGWMNTGVNRLTSTGMYGGADQMSYSGVQVWGGTASMAYRSTTNFAQMTDATYGYQLSGGHNVVLDAGYYEISRFIQDGRGNRGSFYAEGNGAATLDCMSAGASGGGSLQFGRGAGSFTDANFNATGDGGHVSVTGEGNNSVTFNGMGVSSGGGTLSFIADWLGSISIADFSLTAN